MTMISKEKVEFGRAEAVQRFQSLARQIEKGELMLGDKTYKIPEHVRFEIKADNEELEIDMKWNAPSR